jgi:hypothetical protein
MAFRITRSPSTDCCLRPGRADLALSGGAVHSSYVRDAPIASPSVGSYITKRKEAAFVHGFTRSCLRKRIRIGQAGYFPPLFPFSPTRSGHDFSSILSDRSRPARHFCRPSRKGSNCARASHPPPCLLWSLSRTGIGVAPEQQCPYRHFPSSRSSTEVMRLATFCLPFVRTCVRPQRRTRGSERVDA